MKSSGSSGVGLRGSCITRGRSGDLEAEKDKIRKMGGEQIQVKEEAVRFARSGRCSRDHKTIPAACYVKIARSKCTNEHGFSLRASGESRKYEVLLGKWQSRR